MCLVIATYPVANRPKMTAMTVKPVVCWAVGIPPAATVSGATPARTKNSTAGTPSRSRASARDMVLGLVGVEVLDIRSPGCWRFGWEGVSYAVGEQGTVDGRLGLGDQLA